MCVERVIRGCGLRDYIYSCVHVYIAVYYDVEQASMSSRSFRLETRSRARDEIKRIMQTVEKVRKWYAVFELWVGIN